MNIEELIEKIEILKKQIDQLNLSTNDLLRIVPHFRLDWGSDENTVSNDYNIGATKPILLSKLANPKHKFNTDNLLLTDNKIAKILVDTFLNKKNLSKELLFQIHKSIIVDGGHWRNQDVIVNDQTYAVNTFFSKTDQIDFQIEELISWYNKEANLNELHPMLLSTIFHYNFVKIHPFLDGNGRLARIISSLILLSNRLPPPIVNDSDRSDYIYCLRKADLDDLNPLTLFIGKKVMASMEYVLSLKSRNDA